MLKKTILTGLALVAGMGAAQAQDVTLRLAHFAAETHPGHVAAIQFAENVGTRTGGAVAIELYPANQLGSPPEQLEQTILGAVDMNLPTHGGLDKYDRALGTAMTPFAFNSYEHAHAVLDGEFSDWVAPKLEAQGLVMLSHWEYGFRNITNSIKPINAPEDVVGLKLRTPPELQIVAAMEGLGASTTQIAFPELPNALNQGVVQGQENPVGVIYHYNLNDFQEHLALTRHVYNAMIHVVNKDKWDALTPNQQRIIREESAAAGALMRSAVQAQEEEEVAGLIERGMKVTTPDLAPFAALMGDARGRVAEYSGQENMDKFLELLE
ncbi:TRAP transporter substrate-binding protein [Pelagimonas varians]|uniref:2,3-diketo-L-gulonate-binding periplasmic protein YiaO n=1 Tax=Pelagimonas varians TaxID=696760 RepID=A0A238L4A7_9RHOB|nr:TRAP transporter substrate-binding protein [Pelagimonas varians]PYG26374.1 tripartite ATP-independent transporter DctP family solute receptor [Pelagimonas varians]SMX49818.1 2,3-diketo-L-gulonate-binding periplasmic protein YiaO precursor [Pelagimonas varians]